MDNKFLFAIGGLVIGYLIAKKRLEKKLIAESEAKIDTAVNEATQIFDNLLVQAESKGISISELRRHLNAA